MENQLLELLCLGVILGKSQLAKLLLCVLNLLCEFSAVKHYVCL